MRTVIITRSGTRYSLRNGWLTDGRSDYKYHCRLNPLPIFDNSVQVGDRLMALRHDKQVMVTSPVVAVLETAG